MSTVIFLNNCIKNKSTCMLHWYLMMSPDVLQFNKLGCSFIYSRVMFGDKIK